MSPDRPSSRSAPAAATSAMLWAMLFALRIPGLALLAVAAVTLTACGSDSGGPKPTIDKPATAVHCPEGGSWDANELLGKSEQDAEKLAKDNGCTVRVTERDGQGLPATMDFRSERVNVSVDKGVVTKVTGTG